MTDVTVYGFQHSTFVNLVRMVLTHKKVPFAFHDLESEMGGPAHLALHPFDRVPILKHGDFTLYESSAIVAYIDDAFGAPRLTPTDPRQRARMNQWISVVNSYVYPYMIYHISHERRVFPELGIPSDEKVVAHAVPKVATALRVLEAALGHGKPFLLGNDLSLADFYLLPSTFSFSQTPEGKTMMPEYPTVRRWLAGMEDLETVRTFRAAQPPRVPIEHARKWVTSHRPKY
jgi:glutathione S-transferase